MSVPFGIGVGEIIAVGTLTQKVYTAYAGAPVQFRNFSQEILPLLGIVRKIEDQLGISGSGGTARLPGSASLSTKDGDDLKILYDGLRTIMEELGDLFNRYQSLTSTHHKPIDRLRWGHEDLVRLRDKLRSSVTLLHTFCWGLAKYVYSTLTYIDCRNAKMILHLPMYLLDFT